MLSRWMIHKSHSQILLTGELVNTRVAHRYGTGSHGPTRTRTHETRTRNTAVSAKHRGYTANPYGYVSFFHFSMSYPVFFFLSFCFGMYDIFFYYSTITILFVTLCSIKNRILL